MVKIVVFGGTGYAGSAVVAEAAARGLTVVSVSRSTPAVLVEGVEYIEGSATDKDMRARALERADAVVLALSPRGDMAGKIAELYKTLAAETAVIGARLVVVGGFGSLRPAAGQPRFAESDDFEESYRSEALELLSVLEWLQVGAPESLDWLYISPAATFGAFNPGQKRGVYRVNGEVAVFDDNNESNLYSPDLAAMIVDEVETPTRHKEHVSVAY